MTTFSNLYSDDDISHGEFKMINGGFTFNGVVLSNDDLVGLMKRSPAFRSKMAAIAAALRNFLDSGVDLKPGDQVRIGFGHLISKR